MDGFGGDYVDSADEGFSGSDGHNGVALDGAK